MFLQKAILFSVAFFMLTFFTSCEEMENQQQTKEKITKKTKKTKEDLEDEKEDAKGEIPSVGKSRAGSAYTLEGDVYQVCIFVSEKNNGKWTKSQKEKVINTVEESQKWLIKQAKEYDVKLSFQTKVFGMDKDIILDKVERGTGSGNESVDWGNRVFKKLGYKNSYEFYEWVMKNTKCKNTHYVVFVEGEGRGYAMPATTEMGKEFYFMEGAVLYEKHGSTPLLSSDISHETLHTYSAWDLYETFEQTKKNEERAKRKYPNSIMLRTSYTHDELEVDEVTAWLIGWNKKPRKSFEKLKPKRD